MNFGPYSVVVALGRGGMADLFVARAPGEELSLVILKTLRPPITDKRIAMFIDEARLGLLFDHPNVVRTFSVGEADTRPYIAMELLDGQPLDRILTRLRGRASDETTQTVLLHILAEALAGLHHAHELTADGSPLHVVHRDFTPSNLFVTYDGSVKTLDFGIAKSAGKLSRTTTGEVKGKVRYMAPEQALGLRIDRRADVFSAGIILHELLSGAPFWRPETSDRDVFDDLVGGSYPVPLAGSSPQLNAVLERALARDASERFSTAEEMRQAIREEIARRGPRGDEALHRATATLISELFGDQRARTSEMIERALGENERREHPPKAPPSSPAVFEAERLSTFRRLVTRFGMSLALAAGAALFAPDARADEPTAATATDAEQHFKRGLELFDDGDFKLALVEFERSYEISPNVRVLYNIGEVQYQLNHYASAFRTLTRYLDVGGERILPDRRAAVERDIAALKIRTAHLRVNVDIAEAEVLLDGERIGRTPLGESQLVDAGAHRVVVQRNGFIPSNDSVTLAGGDDRSIEVRLAPVTQAHDEPRVIEVHHTSSSGLGPVWIGWGLTVALGIGTVGSLVAWQSAEDKLTDLKASPSSATERASQARSVETLRTVTFIAGGATLAAGGVSLFFTLRRSNESKTAQAYAPRFGIGPGRIEALAHF